MNRCSQVLADKCTTSLAEFVQNSLPIQVDRLTFNASLKYLLLNDPNIAVEISSPTSFEIFESNLGIIVPNGPAISQARLSDFLLGANRVRKQYETIILMRDAGTSAAWLIVSTYYCAYFACIELCKIVNRISLSFEDDELSCLRVKAVGIDPCAIFCQRTIELRRNRACRKACISFSRDKATFRSLGKCVACSSSSAWQ